MRQKLTDKIIEKYHEMNGVAQEALVMEAIRRLSDTSLIAFAIEINIDTDAIFEGKQ